MQRVQFAAALAACALTAAYSVEMTIVNVAGAPRFVVDGRPVAATAVVPSPAGKNKGTYPLGK